MCVQLWYRSTPAKEKEAQIHDHISIKLLLVKLMTQTTTSLQPQWPIVPGINGHGGQ